MDRIRTSAFLSALSAVRAVCRLRTAQGCADALQQRVHRTCLCLPAPRWALLAVPCVHCCRLSLRCHAGRVMHVRMHVHMMCICRTCPSVHSSTARQRGAAWGCAPRPRVGSGIPRGEHRLVLLRRAKGRGKCYYTFPRSCKIAYSVRSQTLGCQAGKTSLRAPALSRALDSEVSKARYSAQSAQGRSPRTASQNAHE